MPIMPSLFWAVLAGTALLGGAVIVHLLSGRELARTRANLFDAMRFLESTKRAKARAPAQPQWPAGSSQYSNQQLDALTYQQRLQSQQRRE